jgi:small subunit ribosomal protein S3
MGQKVSPYGFRVGITEDWLSRWYAAKGDFSKYLVEDQKIREFIKKNYRFAAISKIEIKRPGEKADIEVNLHTARPGIVIGRKGAEIDKMSTAIETITGKVAEIRVKEVPKPELDAQLVAEAIAEQLEKRSSFRRAMRRAVDATMSTGAEGVKVIISGRIGGAEIARSEGYTQGKIPLSTLDAKIGYGFAEAVTTYGKIGVKVWIYTEEKEAGKTDAADAKKGKV